MFLGIFVNCEDPYPLLPDTIKKPMDSQRSSGKGFSSTLPTVLPSLVNPQVLTHYENLPTDDRRKSSKIYTNPSFVNDEDIDEIIPEPVAPHFANTRDEYFEDNSSKLVVEPELHAPPPVSRCETPFSEIDENEVESMFDNVIRVGKETLERQQMEEEEEKKRKAQKEEDEKKRRLKETTVKDQLNEEHLYSSHIETSFVKPPNRDPKPDIVKHTSTAVADSSVRNSLRSSMVAEAQSRHRGSYISETSSGTPMGVIQPTVLQKEEFARSILTGEQTKEPQSLITNMEDVPEDITSLTVEDVCMCLKLLNMDNHMAEFRSHQIDGKLLCDIRENLLLTEFHFTPFNASKLMRFVRGWRPKFI